MGGQEGDSCRASSRRLARMVAQASRVGLSPDCRGSGRSGVAESEIIMPSRVTVNFRQDMFSMGERARILDARRERLTEQRAKLSTVMLKPVEQGGSAF